MSNGLVEAMAIAAREARESRGVSREKIAVELGQSAEKIRYFESGRAFVALSELMDAYEGTTGVSLFDLLDETKAILKKNGRPSSSS